MTNLSIYYSASNDSTTWTSWNRATNNTITTTNMLARYFRYLVKFNTNGTNLTPILNDVTVNYTGIFTNRFGNYNYTFNAPAALGTYAIKVNATFNNIPGERSAALTVNTCFCPASGNWVINDACVLTTACTMDGSNIYIAAGSSLTINSGGSISNFGDIFAYGDLFCRADVCFG